MDYNSLSKVNENINSGANERMLLRSKARPEIFKNQILLCRQQKLLFTP